MENPVIEFLLQSEQAEIPARKNKQLKSIIIDGRRYLYNKSRPVSKILSKKLQSVRNTQEYKSFANEKVRTTILKKRLDNALKTYVMKSRVKTTRVQKAFKSYANSFTLVNEQYTGERGLSYIQFQKNRFKQFLAENRNMKLNIKAEGLFIKYDKDTGETVELLQNLPATRFDIYNEDELVGALENSVKQILLGIENIELRASNFQFLKITTITFHYDRYDPTRAGSYILLPEPIKNKKACINIQNEDNKCFKYCVQCHAFKIYEKKNSDRMSQYKDLQDDIFDWSDVKFPVGNNEIGRFEQKHKGLVAINVFEPDDVFNDKGTVPIKSREALKSEMRNTILIYLEFTMKMENIITYMLNQKAGY